MRLDLSGSKSPPGVKGDDYSFSASPQWQNMARFGTVILCRKETRRERRDVK